MKKRINWKPYLIAGSIALFIGAFIFVLLFLIIQRPLLDGTAFAALVLLTVGVLIWVTREGLFDIFAYGFRQMGTMIFSKKPNEIKDFPGYKEHKNELRKNRSNYYLAFIAIGLLFLLATIIIYIITKP